MKNSDDFILQWKSLTDYLVSQMIKSNQEAKVPDHAEMNRFYHNEILRWEIEGQHNAEWLKNLEKQNKEIAQQFLSELRAFSFEKPKEASDFSGLCIGGAAAGGIGIGLGLTGMMKFAGILTVIAPIAMGAVGGGIGKTLSEHMREKENDRICDFYKTQLKAEEQKLLEIVQRADVQALYNK